MYTDRADSGTIAEWVRALALSHSKLMGPSSNPGKDRNYFYSWIGDGGLSSTRIYGFGLSVKA